MKKILILFPAFFLLLFSAGCIEVQTLIRINDDGTGTIEERVLMSKEIVNMIGEFTSSFSEDTLNAQPFELFDEVKLKEQAINFGAVSYKKGEKIITDEKEGYTAIYSFQNINEVKIDQNPGRQIPLLAEETGETDPAEIVTFSFVKGNPSELTINMPEKDLKSDEDEGEDSESYEESDSLYNEPYDSLSTEPDTLSKQQEMEEARRFLKDLKMSFVVNVEGSIEETNAANVNENEITLFKIDFNELLEDPEKWNEFMNKDPESFEEVKEIIKDLPGIKVELSNPVIVKFN